MFKNVESLTFSLTLFNPLSLIIVGLIVILAAATLCCLERKNISAYLREQSLSLFLLQLFLNQGGTKNSEGDLASRRIAVTTISLAALLIHILFSANLLTNLLNGGVRGISNIFELQQQGYKMYKDSRMTGLKEFNEITNFNPDLVLRILSGQKIAVVTLPSFINMEVVGTQNSDFYRKSCQGLSLVTIESGRIRVAMVTKKGNPRAKSYNIK